MILRRATQQDRQAIVDLRSERVAWLAGKSTDQWQVGIGIERFEWRVTESIEAGETWVATVGDEVVGTVAVDQWANPGLWSAEELADCLVVHRMITRRSSDKRVGSALLAHADQLAVDARKNFLRLDAWTDNQELHCHWKRAGFRHVRTVLPHESKSTALFERPVSSALSDSSAPPRIQESTQCSAPS